MDPRKKAVWGWAMYDWANSTFATTVMSGFFPVFFKQYWSAGVDVNLLDFTLDHFSQPGRRCANSESQHQTRGDYTKLDHSISPLLSCYQADVPARLPSDA